MEKSNAVAALAALAQDNRLDVYGVLVQAGPDGLPAGQVAAALKDCCQGRAGQCVPAARMKRTPATARRKEPVT